MKKYLLMIMLPALIAFAGCDKNDGDDEREVVVPDQSELNQSAYADEETSGGITFMATAPWAAHVRETTPAPQSGRSGTLPATRAKGLPWLTLDKYDGQAGQFTLTITLESNYTGSTRTAEIDIKAGNTSITVKVTQEGKTETGEVPDPPVAVTSVTLNKSALTLSVDDKETLTATVFPENATVKSISWSSDNTAVATVDILTGEVTAVAKGTANITAASTTDNTKKATCVVTVSSEAKQIKSIQITESDGTITDTWPVTFSYDSQNRLTSITEDDNSYTFTYGSHTVTLNAKVDGEGDKQFTVTLNSDGSASKVTERDENDIELLFTYTNGRLVKNASNGSDHNFKWQNGNLVKSWSGNYEPDDDEYGSELYAFSAHTNDRTMGDLNMLFIAPPFSSSVWGGFGLTEVLGFANLLGKRSANLTTTFFYDMVAHESRPEDPYYFSDEGIKEPLSYTFAGGFPNTITAKWIIRKYKKYRDGLTPQELVSTTNHIRTYEIIYVE